MLSPKGLCRTGWRGAMTDTPIPVCREDFAEKILESSDKSVRNYGFLDGGFYTVLGKCLIYGCFAL